MRFIGTGNRTKYAPSCRQGENQYWRNYGTRNVETSWKRRIFSREVPGDDSSTPRPFVRSVANNCVNIGFFFLINYTGLYLFLISSAVLTFARLSDLTKSDREKKRTKKKYIRNRCSRTGRFLYKLTNKIRRRKNKKICLGHPKKGNVEVTRLAVTIL